MTSEISFKIINIEGDGCHALIKAKFNHSKIGYLILDTGASKSVFDMELVSPLVELIEVNKENIKSSGISERFLHNKVGILPELKIGKLNIEKSTVILLDLSHINALYAQFSKKKIWGLLGGDFFKDYKAKINYKNKKITLNF